MNSLNKITIRILLFILLFNSYPWNGLSQENLVVYTDRDFCVSGDTLWFKIYLAGNNEQRGNIVRVQLETATKNLISVIAKKAKNNWADGYFHIPDSLSTGHCFITAFLNGQRNDGDLQVYSKSILIYNRFENRISEINGFQSDLKQDITEYSSFIEIETNKDSYKSREEVGVTIRSRANLNAAVVKASLIDPLAKETGGIYRFDVNTDNENIPGFVERDGILISGKVTNEQGIGVSGVLVFLSITGDPPYFDYYVTGKEGFFHFFLKNAVGEARIFLQVISENGMDYHVQLERNVLLVKDEPVLVSKILTREQSDFTETIIQACFVYKIFNPLLSAKASNFSIPVRFSMPFYGLPTNRIYPHEFIDLPDFREISRELIPGLQYRIRNNEIIFRMINSSQNSFFDDEPLRLLNGIPVFNNRLFAGLKSTDISYIDIVQNERIYGDLKINGVLSVSLKDKSNYWMSQVPQIFEFNVNCLQQDKKPGYLDGINYNENEPDIRQTYLWQELIKGITSFYQFQLSDLKGDVEILVEGLTEEGSVIKTSKLIKVE